MMRPISDLRSRLAQVNHDLLTSWAPPTAEAMATATEAVAQRFGTSSPRNFSAMTSARLEEAIGRVRRQNVDIDYRTLRLACHGVSQHLSSDDYVILGDPTCLNALLTAVSSHQPAAAPFSPSL